MFVALSMALRVRRIDHLPPLRLRRHAFDRLGRARFERDAGERRQNARSHDTTKRGRMAQFLLRHRNLPRQCYSHSMVWLAARRRGDGGYSLRWTVSATDGATEPTATVLFTRCEPAWHS